MCCQTQHARNGSYHYHDYSSCLPVAPGDARQHSALMSCMLDGSGIYGLKGENCQELADTDLNECHGHTHALEIDGETLTA